jgi:hypothetical protein
MGVDIEDVYAAKYDARVVAAELSSATTAHSISVHPLPPFPEEPLGSRYKESQGPRFFDDMKTIVGATGLYGDSATTD